jgi:hypothetical protein
MKTMSAKHFLLSIGIDRSKAPSFNEYPYRPPALTLDGNETGR